MNRICRECGYEFDISLFPQAKNRLGKIYHRRLCKYCFYKKYQRKNTIYAEQQKNNDLERFRESEKERGKRWREKHKKEHHAHLLLNRAIKAGEIIKPEKCSKCGREGIKINGHHDDYNKPYNVIWLCDKCHAERHREIKKTEALQQ